MAGNNRNKLISAFFIIAFTLCWCFIAGNALTYGDDSSTGGDIFDQQISDGYLDESNTQKTAYSEARQEDSQALQDGQDSLSQDQETIQNDSVSRDDSPQADSLEETKDGIIVENGEKYYYKNDVLQNNRWILLDGKWMYAGTDGKLYRNTVLVINGKTYGFNDAGIMQTGVFYVGGKEYLADDSGALISNRWALDEKGWKYSGSEGQVLTNQWIYYFGQWYYARNDGYIYQNCIFEVDGNKYYAQSGGSIIQNKWMLNDGKWYYANPGGNFAKNQWIYYYGCWYYAKDDYSIYQNCIFEVDGNKYYAQSSGSIIQNRWMLNGTMQTLAETLPKTSGYIIMDSGIMRLRIVQLSKMTGYM